MRPKLIRFASEYLNIPEEEVLKSDSKIVHAIRFNNEVRVTQLFYPISPFSGAKVLHYGADIGEISREIAARNLSFYYEKDKELEDFARFVNEREGSGVMVLNDKELNKHEFNLVIAMGKDYKEAIDKTNSWLVTQVSDEKILKEFNLFFFHRGGKEVIYMWKRKDANIQ